MRAQNGTEAAVFSPAGPRRGQEETYLQCGKCDYLLYCCTAELQTDEDEGIKTNKLKLRDTL